MRTSSHARCRTDPAFAIRPGKRRVLCKEANAGSLSFCAGSGFKRGTGTGALWFYLPEAAWDVGICSAGGSDESGSPSVAGARSARIDVVPEDDRGVVALVMDADRVRLFGAVGGFAGVEARGRIDRDGRARRAAPPHDQARSGGVRKNRRRFLDDGAHAVRNPDLRRDGGTLLARIPVGRGVRARSILGEVPLSQEAARDGRTVR